MSGTQSAIPTWPAAGEVFELTLDGDAPENQPLEMISRDGYTKEFGWKHDGPTVKGRQTRRFVWVCVGDQPNLDAVRAACLKATIGQGGRIPEGQWREAIKASYPMNDGVHGRGIAEPSWEDEGRRYYPYISAFDESGLYWEAEPWGGDFLWLVEVND